MLELSKVFATPLTQLTAVVHMGEGLLCIPEWQLLHLVLICALVRYLKFLHDRGSTQIELAIAGKC